ncbi:glycosyltransferase family 4 protein [Pedobacter namyangjuensis]|uniref:glycosyltransferase family 4 protein n=1 Tax=Pedobacter namyangjuensis TaxID=600626 RepID=UPI000DE4CC36|nr:glycosyltransferase family 4 protein [Pedobacter namyangjuensis]
MRVAVLSPIAWRTPPTEYGPWEQVASNVTEGLVDLGLDVTLFATGNSITKAKLLSITEQGYDEDKTLDAKVVECLHISNVMERASEFDIIHNHFDFLPLSYSSLIKTPIITTIHGFSSKKILPVYQKYNNTTSYVAISEADKAVGLDYLATVYNGLNVNEFTFVAQPDDYLLFFGRIHRDKGTLDAIKIAEQSKKKLYIVGLVQDHDYFEYEIKPRLSDQIEYLGLAGPERRNELLGGALALLHPIAFDEPFGLSVAEAMLCGTPVIAYNRGSMPELILNQKTGFLVSNVEQAVDVVNDLHQIKRLDCRTWAIDKFSKERMVQDYYTCYQNILNR